MLEDYYAFRAALYKWTFIALVVVVGAAWAISRFDPGWYTREVDIDLSRGP